MDSSGSRRKAKIIGVHKMNASSKIDRFGPAIVEAVRKGVPMSFACANIDLDPTTIWIWRKRYGELCVLRDSMTSIQFEKHMNLTTKHDRGILRTFDQIKRAEAEFVDSTIKLISKSARGYDEVRETYRRRKTKDGNTKLVLEEKIVNKKSSWTAAAWLLERRFPDQFGHNRVPQDDTADQVAEEIERACEE